MRADFVAAATLEIYKYVPSALLREAGELGLLPYEDFIRLYAKARYLQELEQHNFAEAIAKVFGSE